MLKKKSWHKLRRYIIFDYRKH